MSDVKSDSITSIEKGVPLSPSTDRAESIESVDYPEGGLQAWLAVAGAWLVQFGTFGYTQSFGVYQDFYLEDFLKTNTASEISWIGSVQVLLVLSSGLITGYAFDRGYFYWLNTGGCVLLVFCLFMLSLAKPEHYYQVFLSHGLGGGLGVGLTYVPSMAVLAHHFKKRRAFVMGIASAGSCIGSIVHPIMLNHLFANPSVGFANGVRASAGMNLGVLLIGCVLIRTRLPPKEGMGATSLFGNAKKFLTDKVYIVTVIAAFLTVLGAFFPIFFLQLDAITRGLNPNFAFDTLAILYSGSFIGRILPNYLARRWGIFNVMVISVIGCTALLFGMIGVTTVGGTIAFAILYGFFSGAFVSLLSPLLASLADDVSEVGARMGISHTFNGIGGFIGVPIGAALLGTTNTWTHAILFSSICIAVGSGFFIVARMMLAARKGTSIV